MSIWLEVTSRGRLTFSDCCLPTELPVLYEYPSSKPCKPGEFSSRVCCTVLSGYQHPSHAHQYAARVPGLAICPYYPLTYRLIVSFLDIPELSMLASTCHYLASLTADPILQRTRLLIVAPSRVSHSLFGIGPEESPLRPTVSGLVRRGITKGLDIERRWRAGLYLYSALAGIPSRNSPGSQGGLKYHTNIQILVDY